MRIALLMLVAIVMLAACPRPEPATEGDADRGPQVNAEQGLALFESDTELLSAALSSELMDERHFAMLAVNSYGLTGFEDRLRALAGDDPVAASVVAAVYQDARALPDFYLSCPPGQRIGPVLGAVYGLGCASRVPAASWASIIEDAAEIEMDELLWGLAQLDVEPGGPLQRADRLAAVLATEYSYATQSGNLYRQGALDALLGGGDGHRIDWEPYVGHVPQSHWNGVQWAALLRWADREVWVRILGLPDVHEAILLELAKALVLVGPADLSLPGGAGRLTTMGLGRESRAVGFMNGHADTMALEELETLTGATDEVAPGVEDEAEYKRQAYNLALADTLALLDYALIRGDSQFVGKLLAALPQLPDNARNGVLATIMRRRPAALSDEQLEALIAIEDRGVGYFLLLGWYDRPAVQQSRTYSLVRSSPGHDNTLIAAGYQCWLEQQGL